VANPFGGTDGLTIDPPSFNFDHSYVIIGQPIASPLLSGFASSCNVKYKMGQKLYCILSFTTFVYYYMERRIMYQNDRFCAGSLRVKLVYCTSLTALKYSLHKPSLAAALYRMSY